MIADASSLLGRLRRVRPLTALPFVVFLGWILAVAIIIHATPLQGEDPPDALADALATAIETKDAGAAERLIADSPDTDAIADFLAEAACGSGSVAAHAVVRGEATYVQIVSPGAGSCGQVPIAERDGRWFVDLWAAPIHR
jgi:hypothetical protein